MAHKPSIMGFAPSRGADQQERQQTIDGGSRSEQQATEYTTRPNPKNQRLKSTVPRTSLDKIALAKNEATADPQVCARFGAVTVLSTHQVGKEGEYSNKATFIVEMMEDSVYSRRTGKYNHY